MKGTLIVCACLVALIGCGQGDSQQSAGEEKSKAAQSGSEQANSQQPSKSNNEIKIKAESQRKVGLEIAEVRSRSIAVSFSAPGQIMMNEDHTVHVGSYADGRVTELNATIGSEVRRGTVLARLHSHSVHETRAALDSATAEIRRQQDAVDYRTRMRDRMQRLIELKSASPQELERSQSDLRSAQTDLQNARINQQKETTHLADLLRIPESQAGNITEQTELAPILAPIDGVVVDRKVGLGTIVEPGVETFTITNLASVWMVASIGEPDIAKVRVGSVATVSSQAYPEETFSGRVTYIAPQIDPQTRTLQVRILLPNGKRKLHPGLFANAQIAQGASRRSIFVSEKALQNLNGGSVVFVKTGPDTFEPRPVSIARRANGEAEIAAGLKDGETIVTDGSFVVKSELLKSQIGQ